MNFEPQKFFIGIIDFFSVLLPGALLTYMLMGTVGPLLLGVESYKALDGTQGGMMFLFISYLLGHFVFMLGSLADELDSVLRQSTTQAQARQLAEGRRLRAKSLRWLARLLLSDKDSAVCRVVPIKKHYLDRVGADSSINAFQWSKTRLSKSNPEGLATVQRFEADSKFFRSLMVVPLILTVWGLWNKLALSVFCLPLLLLSFFRFEMQRMKATSHAYWYILAEEAANTQTGYTPACTDVDGCTHAGGVVYRDKGGSRGYLLVESSKQHGEWVLPKGHIETGESTQTAAIREVFEESGTWGCIEDDLGIVDIPVPGNPVKARFYLMKCLEAGKALEGRRIH